MTDLEKKRDNFRQWLEAYDLSAHSAAKKANVSPGAIYNFLAGTSKSLSSGVLQKLAAATGSDVDAILSGPSGMGPELISVTHLIGAGGSLFEVQEFDEPISLERPAGLDKVARYAAAIIDGEGLSPIPDGWAVFFEAELTPASEAVGAICVVRFSGGGTRPVVRTILPGSNPELYSLQHLSGQLTEDVEVRTAQRVVALVASNTEPYAHGGRHVRD
jgi:transcriptional regulator with XRE-family HTH domain